MLFVQIIFQSPYIMDKWVVSKNLQNISVRCVVEYEASILLLLLILYSYSKVQHSYKVRKNFTYEAALTIRRKGIKRRDEVHKKK